MLQLWGVSLRILHGLSFPLGKHVFMHHPTLSLFRPSDHPPGGLQRRTPNRNCLYSVLLLRQGLLLLAERPSSLHERCLYTILLAPHYRSYERLDSQFRPHTLSFSKTIQSAPVPIFTRLTASACCKPKLRFIHSRSIWENSPPFSARFAQSKWQEKGTGRNDRWSALYLIDSCGQSALPSDAIAFFKYNTYLCSIWFSTVRDRWLTWRW